MCLKSGKYPCGHCAECIRYRRNAWLQRCLGEYETSKKSLFFTLTYDDCHLPVGSDGLSYPRYRDLQLFFKRLRKQCGSLKFLVVSEYGPNTGRVHWHGIIFFYDYNFLFDKSGKDLNEIFYGFWQHGYTYCSWTKSRKAISYTLKYVDKSYAQTDSNRQKNVFKCSNGIGKEYFDKIKDRYSQVPFGSPLYITYRDAATHKNYAYRLCRYYRSRLNGSSVDFRRFVNPAERPKNFDTQSNYKLSMRYVEQLYERIIKGFYNANDLGSPGLSRSVCQLSQIYPRARFEADLRSCCKNNFWRYQQYPCQTLLNVLGSLVSSQGISLCKEIYDTEYRAAQDSAYRLQTRRRLYRDIGVNIKRQNTIYDQFDGRQLRRCDALFFDGCYATAD